MKRRAPLRAAVVATAAIAASCSPKDAARPPPPPKLSAVALAPPDLASGPWGEHRSQRQNLRVPLPDAPSWTVEEDRSPWIEAKHRAASAHLIVRVWREDEIANRERCEARARLGRALPEREGAEIIESRAVLVPRGFDTVADVGVIASGRDEPLKGFVMAFGSSLRRCFAYVLVTTAEGKGAEEIIATRLATMVELSLSNVTLEDDRDPTIPRQPLRGP